MPRMASGANPGRRPSRPPAAGAVGIVAAAVSTVMFAATMLGATSDPPMSLVESSLPAWLIVLGLLAGLAVIGAAWTVTQRATGGGGRTRDGLRRPPRAHLGWHDHPSSGRAGGSACHGTPGRSWRVTVRPALVAGGPAVRADSSHLCARVHCRDRARRRLRSAIRPRLHRHLRPRRSPTGRLRFDPDRVSDRDGPHRVGRHPGDLRTRSGCCPAADPA